VEPGRWACGRASPRAASPPRPPFLSFSQARELRWNAKFSGDGTNVTFSRLFYHEARGRERGREGGRAGGGRAAAPPTPAPPQSFLPERSCPSCTLDAPIVTVNRAYLATLATTGGSELPFVLGGVPTALAAALGAFSAALQAGGVPAAAAAAAAAHQWAACDLWPADMGARIEWCAWAAGAAGGGVAPGAPGTALDDGTAGALLGVLMGNATLADAQ